MLLEKERQDVVKYCQKLITSGLTKGTGGNISILNREKGLFAISPSGIDYFETEPEDVVVMDL
ncbi:MAG: class II aldolase/adducin family protein, partial [Eubacterium aggregans]